MRIRDIVALAVALAPCAVGAAAETREPAIGYCTGDIEPAAAAGFDYAEIRIRELVKLSDDDFTQLAARWKAVGLKTPVGHWFLPADLKVVGPEADEARIASYLEKAFARSQAVGLRIAVFGSGDARRAPEGVSREEAFRQLVVVGKRMVALAERYGIVIAVEPLRKAETNTINTTAEGLAWVEAVNHPNFRLMVDLFHLAEEGEDPAIILKAAPYMVHAHISNPRDRVFPLRAEEYDYATFLRMLRRIGYEGRISIEARTENLADEGPKAIAFLRAAWATAGAR